MNPPFGEASRPSKAYIERTYPRTKNDLYTAFVERGLEWLQPGGLLGAITSRTGFFLSSSKKWREEVLLEGAFPVALADLGSGVLDTAAVDTAAYVLERNDTKAALPARRVPFFRMLRHDPEAKGEVLAQSISSLKDGSSNEQVHLTDPSTFSQVPGSPFAYWITDTIRNLFSDLPTLGSTCSIDMGLSTKDDVRFVRLRWEVAPRDISWHGKYRLFAKGGQSAMDILEVDTVVFAQHDFAAIKENLIEKYPYLDGNTDWILHPEYHYGAPGLTFGRRVRRFTPIPLPAQLVFSDSNPSIFGSAETLHWLEMYLSSNLARSILGLMAPPRKIEVGYVGKLPVPGMIEPETKRRLSELATSRYQAALTGASRRETDPRFTIPSLIPGPSANLPTVEHIQDELDTLCAKALGLSEWDRELLVNELDLATGLRDLEGRDAESGDIEDETDLEAQSPNTIDPRNQYVPFVSYAIGCAFGRWDIRFALAPSLAPALPGPFDPLPVCAPGMLVAPDGLPAGQGRIVSKEWIMARPDAITLPPAESVTDPIIADVDYLLHLNWDGILLDDPDHPEDVVGRVREVLELLWPERTAQVEEDACRFLEVKALRDYFRNPKGYWEDHVKSYSKSPRKAPIYWLLQSHHRHYALWLYYHRLDRDLLYKALRNYVEPKRRLEEQRLREFQDRMAATPEGRDRKGLERQVEAQTELRNDVVDFAERLEKVAALGLEPDLDDGVILNIAPLHDLVPWKEPKKYWDDLLAGKYEWSSIGKQLRAKGLVRG